MEVVAEVFAKIREVLDIIKNFFNEILGKDAE